MSVSQSEIGVWETGQWENWDAKTLCHGESHWLCVCVCMNALVFFGACKKRNREDLFWPCFDLCFFQYYEMSYGLNIEMHKQVGKVFFIFCYSNVEKKNWFKPHCRRCHMNANGTKDQHEFLRLNFEICSSCWISTLFIL